MSNVSELRRKLIRQPRNEGLKQKDDGSWEATCHYATEWKTCFSVMPRRNSHRHPDFHHMIASSVSVAKQSPGIAFITVTYTGLPTTDAGDFGLDSQDEPVINIGNSTSQEPIETHPDFTSVIGGTSSAPLNSAKFDQDGVFTGFEADSAFAGVTAYVVPSTTYQRTYVSRQRPTSIANVGKIDTPPDAPTQPSGHTWLKTGLSYDRKGGVYSVSEEWMLSGPSGWNTSIYESA